jgi:Ala-tRNA(Pro) deacylase
MSGTVFDRICQLLDSCETHYKILLHASCRTSAESALARAKAGFRNVVGAKALLMRIALTNSRSKFVIVVLPGPRRLDSSALKKELPEFKKHRFASVEELAELCEVCPGALPPFGQTIFPRIAELFVDESLTTVDTIAFNAGSLEKSIVMASDDYIRVARPAAIVKISLAD